MDESTDTLIRRELGPDERLLWSGRPGQGIRFRRSDFLLIPFSLMWGGFAIFWEFSALSMGAPIFFALWGIPFVLVGLYMIAGRFVVEAKQRERTAYGLTNQRAVIVSGLLTRRVKSLSLRSLSDIGFEEGANGTGTITFGTPSPFSWRLPGSSWPGMPQAPGFEIISDARTVFDSIRKAQAGAA
jgi:hypothetical protein